MKNRLRTLEFPQPSPEGNCVDPVRELRGGRSRLIILITPVWGARSAQEGGGSWSARGCSAGPWRPGFPEAPFHRQDWVAFLTGWNQIPASGARLAGSPAASLGLS